MRVVVPIRWALALGLTACAWPSPPEVAEAPALRRTYRVLAVGPLVVTSIAVDSQLASTPAARMVDGNLSTQWTNGGYRNPTSWARVGFAASTALTSVQIKTGTSPAGTSYDVQTSADGLSWTTRLANQRNATWNLETKVLPAGTTGRFVRIFWRNSPTAPQAHFSIYELKVFGELGGATPAPSASPVPSATPTGTPSGAYSQDFSGVAVGASPTDWINVADLGLSYPWLVRGQWSVVTPDYGGRVLRQSRMDWPWYRNAPPLSFMRFNSSHFGMPENGLPNRYRVHTVLRVIDCAPNDPYYPIGDPGVQFYYLDPTHYLEVVFRPTTIDIWEANGGQPFASTGWRLLGRYTTAVSQRTPLTVQAEVDVAAQRLTVTLPSGARVSFSSSLLSTRPHWMTVRASNSVVDYDAVTVTPF